MKMQIEIAVKMPKATRQPGLPETGRGQKKKKKGIRSWRFPKRQDPDFELLATPVLLSGKSHGWRSLVGCSPWDCEESDTTE